MEKYDPMATLLPYLDSSRAGLCLKLSFEQAEFREKNPFPFIVMIDSDPLVRLIEARFITDEGSELKRVFLLVQRDRYLFQKDELWPISNPKIDDLWQEAFSFYSNRDLETPLVILSRQINEKGKLRPLHPLFFCKTRQVFFHPPCPRCGSLLHPCYDDELLAHSGLQLYSTSLNRYLFCPSCFQNGSPEFYVYELEKNNFLEPGVKDRQSLIKEFGQLIINRRLNSQFPCLECPLHQGCYGPDNQFISRILPFSFYPFYMFIFEAMSLHALDFLSLLSGASFDEVEDRLLKSGERGRALSLISLQQKELVKTPFLFDLPQKNFFEVFYLKLTFLEDIIQDIFLYGGLDGPYDLKFSIDRVWVKLSGQGKLLPSFWNFEVKILDIGATPFAEKPFPKPPASSILYFLTRLWFYTLLVNRKQNISEVYQALNKEGGRFLENGLTESFLSVNIFWNPEGKGIGKKAEPLWEKALHLGWSLYQNSFNNSIGWSQKEFLEELGGLREEVRKNLFLEGPTAQDRIVGFKEEADIKAEGETQAERETIRNILIRILEKWRLESQEEEVTPETIILSPSGTPGTSSRPSPLDRGERIAESSKEIEKIVISGETPQESYEEDSFAETVILGPGKGIPKPSKELPEEDFLSETVILSPQKIQEKNKK